MILKNNNKVWTVLAILIFLSIASPAIAQNPVQIKFDEAMVNYEWEEYNEAIAVFDDLLAQYPTSDLVDDIEYMLGQCYVRTERYDDAIYAFYKTAYTYPWSNRSDDALMALAGVLYRENYIPEALGTYEQLVEKYPQSKHAAYAQTCIGWLYGGMNDSQKAKIELQKVNTNYPNSSYADVAIESIAHMESEQRKTNNQTDIKENNLQINISSSNKNPVVNFDVSTVSGGPFEAPVWVKFYPSGTYDPDGYIILFEIDMNGDGIYDVIENTLTGGSYEFTSPGDYTASVRVTDEKGGITIKSKSIVIAGAYEENTIATPVQKEVIKYEQQEVAAGSKPKDDEVNKKLDSIIEDFKVQDKQSNREKESETVYQEHAQQIQKTTAIPQKEFIDYSGDPLTTANMYNPDSLIKRGSWATAVDISRDKTFDGKMTKDMEPGIKWTNGMFVHPGSTGPTEMIYFHNGSDYMLSGFVSITDCIDHCGNNGDCVFIIKADDVELWNSGIIRHRDAPIKFSVSLKNVEKLALITNNGGDNINEDWAMWMDLEIIESEPATRDPVLDNVKVIELETNKDQDDVKPKKKKENKKSKNKVEIFEGIRADIFADTYVYAYSYRNWIDANFGNHDVVTTGWHSTGGEKRTYLKFDVPNMDSETIDKAILKLYHHSSIGKNSATINVHRVSEDWQEGDGIFNDGQSEPIDSTGVLTWNMQPSYNDSIITQFTPKRKTNKWIEIDITTIFRDWINGEPNYGIVLKPNGVLSGRVPTSLYEFYSKEYEDASKIPYVEIQLK